MAISTQARTQPIGLPETQAAVASTLQAFFDCHIAQAAQIDPAYQALWQTLEKVSFDGGKRMRPYLMLLAFQAFNPGTVRPIIPIAASLELLHISMLIHDDVIDRDDIRHGRPNVSGSYLSRYAAFVPDEANRRHYADSAAILAGDLALSSAYLLAGEAKVSEAQRLLAQRLLGEAVFNVAGGELIDTEASFLHDSAPDPMTIYRYKTASYSFVSPLTVGARLAGADETAVMQLRQFGLLLGIAFQLTDDLLGVFGNEADTGKSTVGDIREGKHTYLAAQTRQLCPAADRQQFDALYGKQDLTEEEARQVRTIMERSGARARTEAAADDHGRQAAEILRGIAMDEAIRPPLEELIVRCTRRSY
ncbi:polyprenyl synthetase family protein [Candidatus Saccharibacteria bacterium]|nr:polyprenyl synthetase family protein [Candidatus Saccharibacteria bacterium]